MFGSLRPSVRLNCEQVEDRCVPAWFMVRMISPSEGYDGSTVATYVDGGLNTRPEYDIDQPGYAYVDAPTAGDAVREVVTGTVRMYVPPISPTQPAEVRSYTFAVSTAGFAAADHKPFLVQPGASMPLFPPPPPITPGADLWGIYLEDLSFHPDICDWDYNDRSWVAEVLSVANPPTGPGSIAGTVWRDDPTQNNPHRQDLPPEQRRMDVRVELYRASGQFVRSTYTDGSGNYQFTGVPIGTYHVHVMPSFFEGFVTPNYGTNDAIDSDVDTDGWSDPVPITPGAPSADIDAGVYLVAPPDANSPDVMIVLPSKRAMAPELKVAKWQNDAFGEEAIPNVNERFFNPRLKKVDASGQDFIDRDEDRFHVLVRDTAAYPNTPGIKAKIKTQNAVLRADYNDDENEIALVKVTDWPGWYWSDSQILVSNDTDDDLDKNTVLANWPANPVGNNKIPSLGEDDVGPSATEFNTKGGYSFPVSDRTHKVALGGKVIASYGTAAPAEVDVKIRKSVNLTVYILKQPNFQGGEMLVSMDKVVTHIRRARELYAQVGIDIPAVSITSYNVPGATPGPNGYPAVDLSNGLDPATEDDDNQRVFPPEMKNLLENTTTRTTTANGVDDIEVYYVNFSAPNNEYLGQAMARIKVRDAKYYDTVVMYGDDADDDTLAHEVWHVIENVGEHYPYGKREWGLDRINLMIAGGDGRDNRSDPLQIHHSVRLDKNQQTQADNGTKPGDPKLLY